MTSTAFSFNILPAISMSDPMDIAQSKGKTEQRIEHLEQVETITSPGEVEKGRTLTPPTSGPVIHEKVIPSQTHYQIFADFVRCHGNSL
jgi:hypothetical protein